MKVIFIAGSPERRSNFFSLLTTTLDCQGVTNDSDSTLNAIHSALAARRQDRLRVFLVPQRGTQEFATFQRHFPNDLLGVNADEFPDDAGMLYFINTTILNQV